MQRSSDADAALAFLSTIDAAALRAPGASDLVRGHLAALYAHGMLGAVFFGLELKERAFTTAHAVAQSHGGPLSAVVVHGVDAEQVWAQLELFNEPHTQWLKSALRRLTHLADVSLDELLLASESGEPSADQDAADLVDSFNHSDDDDDGSSPHPEESDADSDAAQHSSARAGPEFFSMAAMERFVQDAERRAAAAGGSEDGADNDDKEDSVQGLIDSAPATLAGGERVGYDDFFGDNAVDGGDEEDDNDGFDFEVEQLQRRDVDEALLSQFETRAQSIAEQIQTLEEAQLEEKHWALKGEVTQADRPESSLLEAYLDFDHVAQSAPVLSEQHTAKLEALVRRRVLEGAWDDVLRKTLQDTAFYKPKVQLDFAKSRKGLGDVMEDAYLRAVGAAGGEEEELTADQKTAQQLFIDMCRSLDALTNHHYRPSAPKTREIFATAKDVPAIQLEEVAPVGVSGARLLAPEEIGGRRNAVEKSGAELDHTDRKKQRKHRKEASKKRDREREAKAKARAAVDPVYAAKLRERKELAAVGTVKGTTVVQSDVGGGTKAGKEFAKSAQFFANLQERTEQDKRDGGKRHKKPKTQETSAAKYKL